MRSPANSALFSSGLWERALESYACAAHLTVKLFDADAHTVSGPIHPTPFFKLFQETTGYDPGLFAECARRCLAQTDGRPAVMVSEFCGLSVVGTSLALDGKIVGAAVGGYAFVDFSQLSQVQRLAQNSGISFERLWQIAREQKPVPRERLVLNGELLQVLGDALLRENYRTRQYEQTVLALQETIRENDLVAIRDPLLVLDANARIRFANQAFYKMFHVSEPDTLDAVLYDLGAGQWNIAELRRMLSEMLPTKGTVEDFELRHDFPGIGSRILKLNAREIVRPAATEPLILLTIEDDTDRTLAEAARRDREVRYRTLFDLSPVAVYSCDAAGVIVDFNSRAAELWGREPKPGDTDQRFCGSYKMHRLDGSFMPHEQCPMAEVLAGAIPEARNMGVQIERPDGSWITVVVNIRALRNDRGEITGAINCFVDVTERERIQAELRTLNADLQHFSYAASHDLQEPLRMVMSYTQLLARQYNGRLDPQADKFIGYAVEGAQRMEALLHDLREYWSVNEQRVENPVGVDCNRALARAIENLELSVRESGTTVTHDDFMPLVMAEELPVTLLFQNLVSNAIKYRRPDEAPRIHISALRSGGSWKIAVADNGIGIEADHFETIFGPFKRLHGREYPGTGLGLAICRKIVQRYQGRIWVESTCGQGSIFCFTLPAQGGES